MHTPTRIILKKSHVPHAKIKMDDSDSSDLDCETDQQATPPRPKRPKIGAARYGTKFSMDWKADFPFIEPGNPEYSFYCNVCNKDVTCHHQGIADVKRHEKSASHTKRVQTVKNTPTLHTMGFVPVGSNLDKQVSSILLYLYLYAVAICR